MCAFVLGLPESKVRVIAPDVGGGFGSKIFLYPEETALVWASKRVGRPIKWTADRSESFLTDAHGRDHVTKAELALDADGNFLALRVKTIANMGAYLSTFASSVPTILYATLLAGQYRTPAIYAEVKAVFTNTAPVDAYRGAGRPEATYRRRAHRRAGGARDGDRPGRAAPPQLHHRVPVRHAGRADLRHRQLRRAPRQGDRRWPTWPASPARREEAEAQRQAARPRLLLLHRGLRPRAVERRRRARRARRAVRGRRGARPPDRHGHRLHRLAQPRPGPRDDLRAGRRRPSSASRSRTSRSSTATPAACRSAWAPTAAARSPSAAAAIVKAVDKVIAKGKKIAAHLLEAADTDIEFENGEFKVAGTDQQGGLGQRRADRLRAAQLPARHARARASTRTPSTTRPTSPIRPAATSARSRSIRRPARRRIEKFIAVDDFGNIINPMIVEGQVHGGIAQGLGQAMLEGCVYDPQSGQLLTGSYMDYAMPRANDLPHFEVDNVVTPCTHNPLGVKGCGEAGAIGSPPAFINALTDALGVKDIAMPATAERVWQAIRQRQAHRPPEPANRRPERNPTCTPSTTSVRRRRAAALAAAGRRRPLPGRRPEPGAGDEAAPRPAERLVDLGAIADLRGITADGDGVTIGAMATPRRGRGVARRAAADPGAGRARRRHRRPDGAQHGHDRRLDRQRRPGGLLSGGGARRSARRSAPTGARSPPTTSSPACSRPRSSPAS